MWFISTSKEFSQSSNNSHIIGSRRSQRLLWCMPGARMNAALAVRTDFRIYNIFARSRNRTGIVLLLQDFKSCASTNSAIRADIHLLSSSKGITNSSSRHAGRSILQSKTLHFHLFFWASLAHPGRKKQP